MIRLLICGYLLLAVIANVASLAAMVW